MKPSRLTSEGSASGLLLTLGLAVFVLGRLVDLAWHATHEHFETAADQVRAAGGRDPDLPHIPLLATNVVIFGGAVWVGFDAWRRRVA